MSCGKDGVGEQEMVTIGDAARLCGVSSRHFRRLADSGLAPLGIRLGRCVRWSKTALNTWMADGCPAIRKGGVA